ncbi:MAG: DHH family phosphoesterase [Erysipelotrichaceae bacterium]|nr:DHH family phosphoesterase [Erysipelotrichaceae bacterium]
MKTRRTIINAAIFIILIVPALIIDIFAGASWKVIVATTTVQIAGLVLLLIAARRSRKNRLLALSRILGEDASHALIYGKVGLIVYDNDYIVQWISEFLDERGFGSFLNKKLTMTIEQSRQLFDGSLDNATVDIEGYKYEIAKADDCQVLYVRDVTETVNIRTTYQNEKLVLGLVHLDNYEETQQYEDEQTLALINSFIIQPLTVWAGQHQAVFRRLRNDRYLALISQENFRGMLAGRFDILETVKKQSEELGVNITLSMAFVSGSASFVELNSMVNELVDLALSRGGDQVIYREIGKDNVYFGGTSQASEKRSKIQARVMAKTIRGIAEQSENIFIVPHSNADMDAIASVIGLSRIFQSYGIETYGVIDDIDIEKVTASVLENNLDKLEPYHHFIDETTAIKMLGNNSTVVVVDHHSEELSAARNLVSMSNRTVIIDHHRRMSENSIIATLIYNEPSASSTVELVAELMQYQESAIQLQEIEATMMYAGILVDTDHLRVHCTSRSFEACSYLVSQSADVIKANDMLKEDYSDFLNRNRILQYCKTYNRSILISAVDQRYKLNRTAISQAADYMASIRDIDAAFVIAMISDDTCSISGRSQSNINVQVILEKMGGGGHFNAAGVQKSGVTVAEMETALKEAIEAYQQEVIL